MKVLVIVKATKESEAGIMPSTEILAAMGKFNEELVNAAVMLAGEGLHPSSKAIRVKFNGTQKTVTRGPFAETSELAAGFWIWNVNSMDDALAWIHANRGHNTARLAKGAARLARETTLVQDIPDSRVLTEKQIRSVRCPVLGVYGGDSDLADLAPWLERLLPDCRTVVVPGHEHSVLVEAPGTVGGHVLSLVRRAGANGPTAGAMRTAAGR